MGDLFDPFAFGVGMVALVNPCGFALLPAYLGFFLGQNDGEQRRIVALNRAQGVGLAMSVGFLTVFGLLGLVFTGLWQAIVEWLPYFNIVLGIGLFVLGIAMIRGFQLVIKIPKLEKGTDSASFSSMFLFGVSYALASLSCTIGLFLTAVSSSSASTGFSGRIGGFISYGLGMGLLASVLTLAVAFGKRGLVNRVRSILPKINIISAFLLLIVGPYMIAYGVWELQVLNNPTDVTPWLDSIIGGALDFQSDLSNWFAAELSIFGRTFSRTGLLGWVFFAINAVLVVLGINARRADKNAKADVDNTKQTANA